MYSRTIMLVNEVTRLSHECNLHVLSIDTFIVELRHSNLFVCLFVHRAGIYLDRALICIPASSFFTNPETYQVVSVPKL